MKLLAAALVAASSATTVAGGVGTPCPSDCWNWEASTSTCIIDESKGCFTLTCNYNNIELSFMSKLFNVEDTDTTPFGTEAYSPVFDVNTSRWVMNCNLGECGMAVVTKDVNAVANLEFSFSVAKSMDMLTLSAHSVFISPVASAMKFNCQYPASMDVTSAPITINGAVATGESTQIGSLGNGFTLNLYTDALQTTAANNDNVFIGNPVYAEMSWSVQTASSMVNYYIDDCDLVDGAKRIEFIKDNCYSNSLQVKQLQNDKIVENSSKFSFVAFTVNEADRQTMASTIVCKVKMCIVGETTCASALSMSDGECEGITEPAYAYKAITFGL